MCAGFYCPGRAEDDVYGGSKPIIVSDGGSTSTVEVVQQSMTLDMDIHDFEARKDEIRASLAAQYGVPLEQIELEAPTAGSVQILVTITASDSGGTSVPDLEAAMRAVDDSALASALGVNITSSAPTTLMVIREKDCPRGFWCTAGLEVECDYGFFNPNLNANNQTACIKCPERATTQSKASTRPDECVCEKGYFDADSGSSVSCELCVSGTQCDAIGVTLATIPVKRGYYRRSIDTTDVRKCPDSPVNCSDTPVCAESTSGCRGTVKAAALSGNVSLAETLVEGAELGCAQGLTGVFCRTCDRSNATDQVYYSPADDKQVASCQSCGQTLPATIGLVFGVLALVLVALGLVFAAHRFCLSSSQKAKLAALLKRFNLGIKLKILFTYYQVATKVDTVYEVELPMGVKRLINGLANVAALGITPTGVSTPLECIGLSGYLNGLKFWMIAPVVLVVLVVVGALCSMLVQRRCTRTALIELALPWILRLLFLLYPLVTNVAFEAFPCHEFADGTRWLKVDVSIECSSPLYTDEVVPLAWAAIIVYPIGLIALNATLLGCARKAIINRRQTVLSTAIAFLHKEYEPQFFW